MQTMHQKQLFLPKRPTDYDYAVFSSMAYMSEEQHRQITHDDDYTLNAWQELRQMDWELFRFRPAGSEGFQAAVYINHRNRQLVIAFRGTFDLGGLWTDLRSILANAGTSLQQELAYCLVKQVLEECKQQNYQVTGDLKSYQLSFTGHSLGAWLAELATWHFRDLQVWGVIFDSPGAVPMLKQLSQGRFEDDLDLITYVSRPNLVNTCNLHAGELRQVFPEIPEEREGMKAFLLRTLDAHGMTGILKTFSPRKGHPEKSRAVLQWPSDSGNDAKKLFEIYNSGLSFTNIALLFYQLYNRDLFKYFDFHLNEFVYESGFDEEKLFFGNQHFTNYAQEFDVHFNLHYQLQSDYYQPTSLSLRHFHPKVRQFIKHFTRYRDLIEKADAVPVTLKDLLYQFSVDEAMKMDSHVSLEKNGEDSSDIIQFRDRLTQLIANDDIQMPNLSQLIALLIESHLDKKMDEKIRKHLNSCRINQADTSDLDLLLSRMKFYFLQKIDNVPLFKNDWRLAKNFIQLAIIKQKDQENKEKKIQTETLQNRESYLGAYEAIYSIKQPINVANILDTKTQLLILGRAGIGKTTLIRYIIDLWVHGELWSHYQWIFWVSLRNLNHNNYPDTKTYSWLDIINKECFEGNLPAESLAGLKNYFQKAIAANQVLFLLDGYDELGFTSSMPHIEQALNQMLNAKHVIVTSRPYQISKLKIEQQVEILGFSDNNIEAFVARYFEANISNKENNLLALLKKNPNLWGIAHVPINLLLLCQTWEQEPFDATLLTMTDMYHKIILNQLRRYLAKKSVEHTFVTDAQLFDLGESKHVITALSQLAFNTMTQSQSLIITKEALNQVLSRYKIGLLKEILQFGLLKATEGRGAIESNKNYYFIHLTFQEFLAAYHITMALSLDENQARYQAMKDFIKLNKYDPKYELMLWFVAGLSEYRANIQHDPKPLNDLFNALLSPPRDLAKSYEWWLFAKMLDETKLSIHIDQRNLLMAYASRIVNLFYNALNDNFLIKNVIENFIIRLKSSVFLLHSMVLPQLLQYIDRKDDDFISLKRNAIIALGQLGQATPNVIVALVKQLKDKKANMRMGAAWALGQLGQTTPDAIAALVKLLEDDELWPRAKAAEALGQLGQGTQEVINKLIISMEDQESWVSKSALTAVGQLGKASPEVMVALSKYLEREKGMMWPSEIEVLSQWGQTAPEVIALLLQQLKHKDDKVRRQALAILGQSGQTKPEVINAVAQRLEDENLGVRENALKALGKLGQTTLEVIPFLIQQLDNKDGGISWRAAEALGQSGQAIPEVINALVAQLENKTERKWVSIEAAVALGRLGQISPEVIACLVKLLKDENDPWTKRTIVVDLGRLGQTTPEMIVFFVQQIENKQIYGWELKDTAEALGRFGATPEVINALIKRLDDEDPNMRRTAAEILGQLGQATPNLITILTKQLQDKDESVRGETAKALGRFGQATPEVLVGLIERVKNDESWDIKMYFVPEALSNVYQQQPVVFIFTCLALPSPVECIKIIISQHKGTLSAIFIQDNALQFFINKLSYRIQLSPAQLTQFQMAGEEGMYSIFREPTKEDISFATCIIDGDCNTNLYANGAISVYDNPFFSEKLIVYNTYKRMSAARETLAYQFFHALVLSKNFLQQAIIYFTQPLLSIYPSAIQFQPTNHSINGDFHSNQIAISGKNRNICEPSFNETFIFQENLFSKPQQPKQNASTQAINEFFQSEHIYINEVSQKFTYTFKPANKGDKLLCLPEKCQPEINCEVNILISSLPNQPAAYSSITKSIYNLGDEGIVITTREQCSPQQIEFAFNQTVAHLPNYEQQQWQQIAINASYQISLTAGHSATVTGTILFAEDLALAYGHSPETAKWFGSIARYAIQSAQMAVDIYHGADAMTSFLPLLASNAVYYQLTYASNCSNDTITALSTATYYTARAIISGIVPTVFNFFAATAGSFAGSYFERKTADSLLTAKLQENFQKRLAIFNETVEKVYTELQKLKKQGVPNVENILNQVEPLIKDFYNKTENGTMPTFVLYRQLCHVEQVIDNVSHEILSCNKEVHLPAFG